VCRITAPEDPSALGPQLAFLGLANRVGIVDAARRQLGLGPTENLSLSLGERSGCLIAAMVGTALQWEFSAESRNRPPGA
jgi:hypothetical protein